MKPSQLAVTTNSSRISIIWLIAYQYFVIGVSTSLGSTLVLTYPNLPSYSILSMFTAAHLPFSFKFLIAPFIERYTSIHYGKRKTWIILTCTFIGFLTMLMAMLTDELHQMHIAILYFLLLTFSAIQSISVIALAIKELAEPATVSLVQQVMQSFGDMFGSLIFLKLVSADFAKMIGLSKPICTVQTFFIIVGVVTLLMNIVMHFYLKERIMDEQLDERSLWEIMKEYRVFLDSRTRYFRQAVFFLIINQGHQFFLGGFQYQLIKKGFSKERINEIENFVMIPVVGITYLVSRYNSIPNLWRNIWIVLIIKLLKDIVVFATMPTSVWVVAFILFFANSVATCGTMFSSTLVVSFPVTALSGMFITALNSARNLGGNGALHQWIIHQVGWLAATIFGFLLHGCIIGVFWFMVQWIKEGEMEEAVLTPKPLPIEQRIVHPDVTW